MNLIRAALGELTDLELAYFATYTAINLASETQQQIKLYLRERNLTKTRIRILIEHNEKSKQTESSKVCCPRCKSEKLRYVQEECTAAPVWLTYQDILNNDQPALGTPLSNSPLECKVCDYPIRENAIPKPSVSGIRVFTSSLRS
ncbi:hypothetical protein [Robertkochia flava]|uniref:hypothetical protein n=1 Tax=Robertkochia flava TaxID=3447986 RepID=UPI001CCB0DFF|nr:hypothetical protein [Robertkochia marina]